MYLMIVLVVVSGGPTCFVEEEQRDRHQAIESRRNTAPYSCIEIDDGINIGSIAAREKCSPETKITTKMF